MGNFNLNEPPPPAEDATPQRVMLCKDGKPISRVNCYNRGFDMRRSWTIMSMPSINKLTLPSDKFVMTSDFENGHQAIEWTKFLHFLFEYKKVAVVEPAAYDFYILPPHVPETDKVEVAYRKRNSAFQLERKTCGNHLERCKLEEVPASRNLHSHTNSKFILPMKGHDVDNSLNITARLVQTCDVSDTSLRDSLLHGSHCIEDDPEVLSSAAEEKNILCPSPVCCLEEIAESSHRVVKETQISPTRESSDKHHHQSSAVEPTLRDWKSHFVAEDPDQIKASEYKKNSYMQFAVDGNLTESNAFLKQSRPLPVLHMRNYGSHSTSQTDFSSPTVEYTERNQGFNPITRQPNSLSQSYVRTHPSYFKTLGQIHSGWIFGAIAELVDNARDANAKRLEIFIESMYSKREGKHIPVLSFVDNGCGMSHKEIVRMVSFGHEPQKNDANHIGRYGVGFKTGAMRLGRNALVISQASNSRSLALLSQAFNEDKNDFEIPIVSYARQGNFMDIDTNIQTEAEATAHLKSIKEFSPFNEYFIGEKSALFGKNGTGTQIYIWDLDKWGSDYSLEWTCDDIMIRSKRVRTRAGQISNEAYKRVGGMIHSADMGRGILGVIDVTNIMSYGDDKTYVLSNKQGFEDCEAYAKLEEWLSHKCDVYWDTRYDDLVLVKANATYEPDYEWVQCNKCLKWRRLDSNFESKSLPDSWFCNMEPYNGLCSMPEEKIEPGVVTVSQKRIHRPQELGLIPIGEGQAEGDETECVENPVLKKLRKGPRAGRKCK
ncbi:uncharacterized protein LOC116246399 isoform X2 [Nymphaea colorata]|uniref:uncharacterized protein LOC116246399 isoform X2 n=1 Tax=Nymphaea colorata TaxID=210225 RepID=UPI00129DA362|nr:uncharacterized protein LOC116246399 isoform X2 [Nymphaea colorata]